MTNTYTPSQITLLAAAQLMTQVKEWAVEQNVFRGGVTKPVEDARTALQGWLKENGVELTYISYGYYRVEKAQLAAIANRELTPLPFIAFLMPE